MLTQYPSQWRAWSDTSWQAKDSNPISASTDTKSGLSLCVYTLLAQAGQQVLLLWMTVTGNVPSPKGYLGWLASSLFGNWAGIAPSRAKHKWPINWTRGKKGSTENKHKFEEKPLGDLWPHPFCSDRTEMISGTPASWDLLKPWISSFKWGYWTQLHPTIKK